MLCIEKMNHSSKKIFLTLFLRHLCRVKSPHLQKFTYYLIKKFKIVMKKIRLSFVFALLSVLSFSQVGINTTSPTEELDVNGDIRIRGLANPNSRTVPVYVRPDGTLVNSYSDPSAPGTKFVGFLNSDILLDQDYNYKEIILTNELIDVNNEYDAGLGRYSPLFTGFYKISMDFDIGDYTTDNKDLDILIGLWDFTTGNWVLRRTFKHKDNNNSGMTDGRNESFGISNYLQLTAGHSYGFRIFTDYDPSITGSNRNAKLKYQNSGSTGTSLSSSFSIEKVL